MYDDGGASRHYSNDCSGTLVLKAPTGYMLQLSGNIMTQTHMDELTVYDNNEASGTKLLDKVSSTSHGVQTAIPTVISTGQSMTLYFKSDNRNNFAGLDLTVTLINSNADFGITVNDATGGSVAASIGGNAATTAKVNDVVTLTATPSDGNMLSSISVKDGSNMAVNVAWDGPFYNTATFNMPGSNVTVTPTFTNTLTADGGLYINMPKTGTKTATIPAGVQSFKLYDNGGKSGNYSNGCDGTLVLTAPTGYVLQLSGSIKTENGHDYLTVWDGTDTSDDTKKRLVVSGVATTIETVISTGQSMTLCFHTDGSSISDGLDLTVTLVSTSTNYSIDIINPETGGTVTSSPSSTHAGQTVTLSASPSSGYMLSDISVVDGNSNAVSVTDMLWYTGASTATFSMPGSAVTVTPVFTNSWTADGGLFINMPKTGTKTAPIPAGVQSFKVYDDGGKDGNYSAYCHGTLVLTAPEGCMLQLSGNITAETSWYEYLTVYDNNEASGTKLLDRVSSTSNGTQTAITPVTSSGRNMTLYFYTVRNNYAGLDLTVTVINPNAENSITINNPVTGGSVTSSPSTAKLDGTVTLTATPDEGYFLSNISVVDGLNMAVNVAWDGSFYNTATFTMPTSAVTVTPTFTNTLTADGGLFINMPATGSKPLTIPSGVQSFKVYDDGGSTGNYSGGAGYGSLVLTAPTGYLLQLSGNITTEESYDYINVYDGSSTSLHTSRLLDRISSEHSGVQRAITAVVSSGQNMAIEFYTTSSNNYAGLDLTVTLVPVITLANDDSQAAADAKNSALIDANNGRLAVVTLDGRTLYKDGDWNTLCLPFDVTIAGSVLDGADARELIPANSKLEGSTLTLNFTAENAVTELVAGTPYLIKWSSGEDITNPVFTGVTISKTTPEIVSSTDGTVTFKGIYSPVSWDTENKSILYLGTANKLYWPQPADAEHPVSLNAFRAYFQLDDKVTASEIFLNFDGDEDDNNEATGIKTTNYTNLTYYDGAWYSLDGRKIANGQKPTAKGVYIHNGRKVVVK